MSITSYKNSGNTTLEVSCYGMINSRPICLKPVVSLCFGLLCSCYVIEAETKEQSDFSYCTGVFDFYGFNLTYLIDVKPELSAVVTFGSIDVGLYSV